MTPVAATTYQPEAGSVRVVRAVVAGGWGAVVVGWAVVGAGMAVAAEAVVGGLAVAVRAVTAVVDFPRARVVGAGMVEVGVWVVVRGKGEAM